MAWTIFEYLYRDADNHKVFGKIAFEGAVPDAQWELALIRFDDCSHFIAEQIGLPTLYGQLYRWSGNAPTDADHCWHEFVSLAVVDQSNLDASIPRLGTMAAFVERLMEVNEWNIWLSANVESWRPKYTSD
jgi:predicted AlkP superfamily phosphohydrolase/phosphomutase